MTDQTQAVLRRNYCVQLRIDAQGQSLVCSAGWFGVITALTAFYIAFAELFNDTLKKNVLPLGELSFLTRALGSQTATPYDVNRTDPRGYGPSGIAQRNVRALPLAAPS